MSDTFIIETRYNACEGCANCQFPGIRWPASPDDSSDLSWVERCDTCQLYADDEQAGRSIAEHFGVRWGYAERNHPENVRWAPGADDGLDYTGWSCFVERPERDDLDYHHQPPAMYREIPVSLTLLPGEAHAVLDGLVSARASIGPEYGSGDHDATIYGNTLMRVIERLEEWRRNLPDEETACPSN